MTDYSLWEVILNGNKVLKRTVEEVEQEYEPTSAEEKQDRRNEMKARETLLMALPNKDQLKFYSYKDAKLLMEAIEKRYEGNKESKKVQRTLLKQQYENFLGLSSEIMDQTFDRLQKLISQLEIQGEDHQVQAKIYKMWLLCPPTALTATATATAAQMKQITLLLELVLLILKDLEQIDPDDPEEMDLQWEMAMLTIRARRLIKRTDRQLDVNGQRVRFDRSKVECYNCHKYGHFARECKLLRNQETRGKENNRRTMTVETPLKMHGLLKMELEGSSSSSNSEVDSCSKSCVKAYATLKVQYDSLSSDYKKSQFNLVSYKAEKFQNSSKSLNNLLEIQVSVKSKTGLGYDAASSTAATPAVERNFIPRKPDLTFMDEIVESENMDVTTLVTPSNVKKVVSNHESAGVKNNGDAVEPKIIKENSFRPPVIEDWNSDDDSEVEFIPNDKNVRPSIEKIKFVKSARETVEKVEAPKRNKHYPRGNQRNWNNLMSQILGSPKDSKEDAGMKPTEVDECEASDKDGKDKQDIRISNVGPSFTNDAPSSPVDYARTSKEHLFSQFSPFKNVFTLPPILNVTLMDDTRIFGNANDDKDVGAEADLNNLKQHHGMSNSLYPQPEIDQDIIKTRSLEINFIYSKQGEMRPRFLDEHAMVSTKSSSSTNFSSGKYLVSGDISFLPSCESLNQYPLKAHELHKNYVTSSLLDSSLVDFSIFHLLHLVQSMSSDLPKAISHNLLDLLSEIFP
ncbi:ribonuclease H-like domain-containing protein [Tanacetum coccineum]